MEKVTDKVRYKAVDRLGSKFHSLIEEEETNYKHRVKEDELVYQKRGITEPLALGGAVVVAAAGGVIGGYLANQFLSSLFR